MSDSLTTLQRRRVLQRSHGLCEALVEVGRRDPEGTFDHESWTRCYDRAIEVHHILKRSRGGDVLDRVNEIYHLAHLCGRCHRSSEGQDAYEGGLLIAGQVTWDHIRQRPVYTGPDEYLALTYPEAS
jgi:5-methylcytosine-specific restriction endonuclease McrA